MRKRAELNSTPSEGARSVERAADILLALGRPPDFIGVTALASSVGLGKSTVHRLLQTLVQQRLVAFNPTLQAYGLGGRVLQLGLAYQENHPLASIARPTLSAIRDLTEETATLYLPVGYYSVALENAIGLDGPRVPQRDARALLHVGAFGKVLYAYAPPEFVGRYPDVAASVTSTRIPPIPTAAEVDLVVRTGVARSIEEFRPRTNGLGFPVLNAAGEILAAVAIAGRSDRLTEERMDQLQDAVKEAIAALSAQVATMQPDQAALIGAAERGWLR